MQLSHSLCDNIIQTDKLLSVVQEIKRYSTQLYKGIRQTVSVESLAGVLERQVVTISCNRSYRRLLESKMSIEIPELLNDYIKKLTSQFDIEEIWLFGSRANNTARGDSDWDIWAFANSKSYQP